MTGLFPSKFSPTRWTILTVVRSLTTSSRFKRLFKRKMLDILQRVLIQQGRNWPGLMASPNLKGGLKILRRGH